MSILRSSPGAALQLGTGLGGLQIQTPAPPPGPHVITIDNIATQQPSVAFDVTGDLINFLTAPPSGQLTYTLQQQVVLPSTGLQAVITYNGTRTVYDPGGSVSTNAITNQGTYTDPMGQFTQGSTLVMDPAVPELRIYFRQNLTGSLAHTSIILELGEAFTPFANLMSYTAELYQNGALVMTQAFPTAENKPHFKFTRWRRQSIPFPIRQTAQQIADAGHTPYFVYGKTCLSSQGALSGTYAPMTIIGLSPNMGTTGEHAYMGPVNEYAAQYLARGLNQADMLLYAEQGQGSLPHWYRDPSSHLILDIITAYPNVQATRPPVGSPQLNVGKSNTLGPWAVGDAQLTEDSGHDFEDCYCAYFLTGDPVYEEECQAHANRVLLEYPYNNRYTQDGRYRAWQLRTVGMAAHMSGTTAHAPWLRNKAYFESMLANFKVDYDARAASSDPLQQYWMSSGISKAKIQVPGQSVGCFLDPFTMMMEAWAACLVYYLGYPSWSDVVNWAGLNIVKFWDGASGWYRGSGLPYSLSLFHNTTLRGAVGTVVVPATQAPPFNIPTGGNNVAWPTYFCQTGTTFRPSTTYTVGIYDNNNTTLLEQATVQRASDDSGLTVLTRAINGTTAHDWNGQCVIRTIPVETDMAEVWWINNDIGNQPDIAWYTLGTASAPAPPISNQAAQWRVPPSNTTLFHGTATSVTYPSYARAALAMMDHIGTGAFSTSDAARVTAAFQWLEGQFRTWLSSSWTPMQKWAHYATLAQSE